MIKKDYYKVLQIETSAETEQIHEAYKQLAKDYQQTQSNLSDFIFKMKELNEAYLVLSNSEDREEYDETSDENDILPEIDKEEDTEDEDLEQEIPIEIDENSVKQFRLKIESFSAY
jgi:DnaJ-class molecular chaperone